ncbi:ERF family protein [Streptomyces mutabilis]|uniref:ERF family protein n=1 Tax=Streptomyces mutabilis TaxID=67332 RepID=UPI0022BA62E6|nr:ERF family protein [Streptomyces mutabilis]MCZ9350754.1 ERF family protein [Streptomyces mutabilis]
MTVHPLPLPPSPTAPAMALTSPIYQPAPEGAPTDQPRVFATIANVMRDAMPVGKDQENKQQNYKFRGIDDVMSAMAGPMRKHGLFILPTIADHQQQRDGKMTRVLITMRYYVYGPAGDCLITDMPGEAFDFADKATNKAQSAALKYLLFTLFMLPVDGRSIDDGDRHHPEPSEEHRAEQQQRQQRGQQRRQQRQQGGQQRQQGGQQPRRSQRAEPGPWENQPQQQAPQQQRRDYLTEAHQARTPEQFAAVRAAAVEAGAPADYLARLDSIAAQKRAAAKPQREEPTGPAPYSVSDAVAAEAAYDGPRNGPTDAELRAALDSGHPEVEASAAEALAQRGQLPVSAHQAQTVADRAEQAENALRLAASRANLPTLDADFQTVYGIPIEQATAQQLDAFRARIEAAGGAQ